MKNIPVTFNSDKKGYFDRECPNENCLFNFKVYMPDWKEKFSDEEVYCPKCGYVSDSDKWWTKKQIEQLEKLALSWAENYCSKELGKSFKKLERETRNNKYFKIKYTQSKPIRFTNNPLGQSEEWEQEIVCEFCEAKYSVIGTPFFCPCCGENIVENTFDGSLDTVLKMLNSTDEMKNLLTKSYGIDKATSIIESMIEGIIGDVVGAYQKYTETIYKTISNKKVRVNDFQIIEKGSNLFLESTGKGYDYWLDEDEINFLNKMFQQRHIIEHNNGTVDEKYIKKSNDNLYDVGQRIVVKDYEIIELVNIMQKLKKGLQFLK